MRLLFVIDNLGSGGSQRQMVNLALGLQRRGHQIEFFVYYPQYTFYAPTLNKSKIFVHKWKKKWRFDPNVIIALRRQICRGRYDVVLSFLDTPNLYCELALSGFRRQALVVSERNSYPAGGPSYSKLLIEQFHRLADAIVVNSYYQEHQMMQRYPWICAKLHMIYNGLDLDLYTPREQAHKKQARVLGVGSVTPRKNIVGMARAMVEYKAAYGLPPTLDWAGVVLPTSSSRLEYETAREILRENDLTGNWNWLGERRDLHLLYPEYSALIHPSFQEGLPNVVCEAMACGLPVLVSDFGEHRRLTKDETCGILFDPNSPSDIARALREFVISTEVRRCQMAAEARKFAEREFAMDVFIQKYETLFLALKN